MRAVPKVDIQASKAVSVLCVAPKTGRVFGQRGLVKRIIFELVDHPKRDMIEPAFVVMLKLRRRFNITRQSDHRKGDMR